MQVKVEEIWRYRDLGKEISKKSGNIGFHGSKIHQNLGISELERAVVHPERSKGRSNGAFSNLSRSSPFFLSPLGACRRIGHFLQVPPMSDAKVQPKLDPNGKQWDEDLIYHILNHKYRRNVLLTLARSGPRSASQFGGPKLGSVIAHLVDMIEAGLVVKSPNPNDGRQPIYSLTSAVPVVKTEHGAVIDFGFCEVRL